MKSNFIIVFITTFWVLSCVSSQKNRQENAELNKDYEVFLNQKPPGLIPEIFSPRVISTFKEVMSKDYTLANSRVLCQIPWEYIE